MAPSAIPTFSRSRAASSSSSTDAELQLLQRLETPLKNLSRLAQSFEDVFNHLALTSTAQFLPTPVRVLPNGEETGRFLALDLGGTNLRVGIVELFGEDPPSENGSYDEEDVEEDESAGGGRLKITTQGSWNIPEYLKSSTAERYFAWVAEKMGDVVSGYLDAVGTATREATLAQGMEVGIAFSFPMEYGPRTRTRTFHCYIITVKRKKDLRPNAYCSQTIFPQLCHAHAYGQRLHLCRQQQPIHSPL